MKMLGQNVLYVNWSTIRLYKYSLTIERLSKDEMLRVGSFEIITLRVTATNAVIKQGHIRLTGNFLTETFVRQRTTENPR